MLKKKYNQNIKWLVLIYSIILIPLILMIILSKIFVQPKYDFIYSVCESSQPCKAFDIAEYSVDESSINEKSIDKDEPFTLTDEEINQSIDTEFNTNDKTNYDNIENNYAQKQLKYYDTNKNQAKDISVNEFLNLKIDKSKKSKDNFSLIKINPNLLTKIFNKNNNLALSKNVLSKNLNLTEGDNEYLSRNLEDNFIGWVIK